LEVAFQYLSQKKLTIIGVVFIVTIIIIIIIITSCVITALYHFKLHTVGK